MGLRCGIDLGTTYSSISWFDGDNHRVETIDLDSADGAKMIRSVVYYPGPGEAPVVGDAAVNAARRFPDRVVAGIKRSMGTSYTVPPIDGVPRTPPEVSAEILRALVRDAQRFLGEEFREVVITVPAYFGDNERAATLEAGRLADLEVVALLSEPIAAALAFAVEKVADIVNKSMLVYDLGGGTFDVTLIHVTAAPDDQGRIGLKAEVLCKDGYIELGGMDWDRALAELVGEKLERAHQVNVWADPRNAALLLENSEKAKRHLSRASTASIIADLEHHQVNVSSAELEERTRDLLLQTQMLVERVLDEAERGHGISRDEVGVLLTGGSTRMPMVKSMIAGLTGRPPLVHRNPDLLVSIGAAYWAHLLREGASVPVMVPDAQGRGQPRQVSVQQRDLIEIAAYSVGVEVLRMDAQGRLDRVNAVLIPKGARYGKVFEKEFQTSLDGMTEIPVVLYKGESSDPGECEPLLEFTIMGLPPGAPRANSSE